jgi:hypothetical protein
MRFRNDAVWAPTSWVAIGMRLALASCDRADAELPSRLDQMPPAARPGTDRRTFGLKRIRCVGRGAASACRSTTNVAALFAASGGRLGAALEATVAFAP